MVRKLLGAGADWTAVDGGGHTALEIAAERGDADSMRALADAAAAPPTAARPTDAADGPRGSGPATPAAPGARTTGEWIREIRRAAPEHPLAMLNHSGPPPFWEVKRP
jgi:ankyrin repeat protein